MGESIILVPIPSADPVVGKWREKYDHAALHGIPSHITLLFPFKNWEEINSEVINKLNVIFSKCKSFQFSLSQINTFPNVVFLEPSPKEKFIQLTQEIVKFFPENPPYRGNYQSINPHLTIGQFNPSQDTNKIKEEIAHDIHTRLPIKATAQEVWLMEKVKGDWSVRIKIPLTDEKSVP